MNRVLVIDDAIDKVGETLVDALPGDRLTLVRSGGEALELLSAGREFDAVLLDVKMPVEFGSSEQEEGLAVLARLKEVRPDLPVILVSVVREVETVVRGMRLGAFYYVEKPPDAKRLRHLLERAAEHRRSADEQRNLRRSIDLRDELSMAGAGLYRDGMGRIVGRSPAMQKVFHLIEKVAPLPVPVLILGESGTGKELVAEEIHRLSPRCGGPLVKVNCPAIPAGLLESQLFGHRKGAFTGATEDRTGDFVRADGGTLLLDEVGDMDLGLQAKILRALEQKEVQPVGGKEVVHVDARILASTNADLRKAVDEGKFRGDLFYRLNVISIRLPPLRERPGDIPLLSERFLEEIAARDGRAVPALTEEAARDMAAHSWPGNVRSLRNALEKGSILADASGIRAEDMDLRTPGDSDAGPDRLAAEIADLALAAARRGKPWETSLNDFATKHGEVVLRHLMQKALDQLHHGKEAGKLLRFITADDPDEEAREYANYRRWASKLGVKKG